MDTVTDADMRTEKASRCGSNVPYRPEDTNPDMAMHNAMTEFKTSFITSQTPTHSDLPKSVVSLEPTNVGPHHPRQ